LKALIVAASFLFSSCDGLPENKRNTQPIFLKFPLSELYGRSFGSQGTV
jgi:hypothetical protein